MMLRTSGQSLKELDELIEKAGKLHKTCGTEGVEIFKATQDYRWLQIGLAHAVVKMRALGISEDVLDLIKEHCSEALCAEIFDIVNSYDGDSVYSWDTDDLCEMAEVAKAVKS